MAQTPVDNSVNRPQPVNWWLMSYYPTDAAGQTASIIGVLFQSKAAAIVAARAQLASAGVGMCFIQRVDGEAIYNLYTPTPS